MRRLFTVIEYGLIIIFGFFTIMMIMPFSDMYNFSEMVHDAKKAGTYIEVEQKPQIYFERALDVDGLIYDKHANEAVILMTSRNLFYNSLPNWPTLTIKTKDGKIQTQTSGGGGSSNTLRTQGYYHFEKLPKDIEEITLSKESYGEAFAFKFPLSGGVKAND